MKRLLLIVILTVTYGLRCSAQESATEEAARRSLSGLNGVMVTVSVSETAEKIGIRREDVQTDAELRLRKAGIHIPTLDEFKRESHFPFLAVRIKLRCALDNETPCNLYAYSIRVELIQAVSLYRNKSIITLGTTWSDGVSGAVGSMMTREVRNMTGDFIDEFVNDYLTVNPKH